MDDFKNCKYPHPISVTTINGSAKSVEIKVKNLGKGNVRFIASNHLFQQKWTVFENKHYPVRAKSVESLTSEQIQNSTWEFHKCSVSCNAVTCVGLVTKGTTTSTNSKDKDKEKDKQRESEALRLNNIQLNFHSARVQKKEIVQDGFNSTVNPFAFRQSTERYGEEDEIEQNDKFRQQINHRSSSVYSIEEQEYLTNYELFEQLPNFSPSHDLVKLICEKVNAFDETKFKEMYRFWSFRSSIIFSVDMLHVMPVDNWLWKSIQVTFQSKMIDSGFFYKSFDTDINTTKIEDNDKFWKTLWSLNEEGVSLWDIAYIVSVIDTDEELLLINEEKLSRLTMTKPTSEDVSRTIMGLTRELWFDKNVDTSNCNSISQLKHAVSDLEWPTECFALFF